jgi:flagellar protein FliO/FliZ
MNLYTELLPPALKMLSALVIVIGGMLLVFYGSRRFARGGPLRMNGRLVRTVSSTCIGLKKSIALVDVAGEVLVLGITADRITLLTKIEDPAVLERLQQTDDPAALSFGEQLHRFTARLKNGR